MPSVLSPQVLKGQGKTDPARYDVLELLAELSDARRENRALRRRVAALELSRDRWRKESRGWQWGALRWQRKRSA